MAWNSEYFCGNKVSDYGLEHRRVDYGTLAKAFDAVANDQIFSATDGICGYWEKVHGWIDNSDEIEGLEEQIEELEEANEDAQNELEDLECEATEDDLTPEEYDRLADAIAQKEQEIADRQDDIDRLEAEKDRLEEEQNADEEVMQWYIISDSGAALLMRYTNEIIYRNEDLDMYLWGVTHWGTNWSYVLTDIRIVLNEEEA